MAGDLLAAPLDRDSTSEREAEHLAETLWKLYVGEQDPKRKAGFIWALGKSRNPAYKEKYLRSLQQQVENLLTANSGVYQILIALDNIDVGVFEKDAHGRNSQSLTNVEKNLRQARGYLAKHGMEIPW